MGMGSLFKHRSNEAAARTSAEKNKAVAKNGQVSTTVRARAAGSFIGDKFRARKHKNKAELEEHKMRA